MSGDHVKLEGEVVEVQRGKFFVEIENGEIVTAQLSGKMRKANIRTVLGDKVEIKVSPYDLKNGIIVKRFK